jgi:hypothetical protein
MEYLVKQLDKLPVLSRRRNPVWALVIGFLTGGVGLGVYLRSFIDVMIPPILTVVATYVSAKALGLGWLLGPAVAAAYGYARVENSNARRDQQAQPQPQPQFAQR